MNDSRNESPTDSDELRRRWAAAWLQLGIEDDRSARQTRLPALLTLLLDRYREPHRHYHTLQHLRECLHRADQLAPQAEHPAEIEIALWFHDAIYDTSRSDNEQRCATWAKSTALSLGVDPLSAARLEDLVLVTRHEARTNTLDEAILVDIDLAILGTPTERFDEYERQVRAEYQSIPEVDFRRGRRVILEQFLAREQIYSTDACRRDLEDAARANLRRSIAALGQV